MGSIFIGTIESRRIDLRTTQKKDISMGNKEKEEKKNEKKKEERKRTLFNSYALVYR